MWKKKWDLELWGKLYICIDTDAVVWHFCSSTKSKASNEPIPSG